jgi:hypothetical protein
VNDALIMSRMRYMVRIINARERPTVTMKTETVGVWRACKSV